jgi:hypothetical protein
MANTLSSIKWYYSITNRNVDSTDNDISMTNSNSNSNSKTLHLGSGTRVQAA